jgi:signal peptidase II
VNPRLVGAIAAVLTLAVDQGFKQWMLWGFNIEMRQPVHLARFFDVVIAWNNGISYSLFSAETPAGRMRLLVLTLVATLVLAIWLWRTREKFAAGALGLIIGGALGNACDRYVYGAVADFFYFHVGRFHWYIFNLADVAIVAGVALLLYESLFSRQKAKTGVAPV